MTGLKKTAEELLKSGKQGSFYVLDELYWFINKKADTETKENVYLMTMICPEPRMIVEFEVAIAKLRHRVPVVHKSLNHAKTPAQVP